MKLTTGCIVTEDVTKMSDFYRQVLQIEPNTYGDDYVEFETDLATLSIYSLHSHEKLAPGSIQSISGANIILEFMVDNVDAHYQRLRKMDVELVKPPTTQPWGTRSIYLRDPDGNIVNLYMHVS